MARYVSITLVSEFVGIIQQQWRIWCYVTGHLFRSWQPQKLMSCKNQDWFFSLYVSMRHHSFFFLPSTFNQSWNEEANTKITILLGCSALRIAPWFIWDSLWHGNFWFRNSNEKLFPGSQKSKRRNFDGRHYYFKTGMRVYGWTDRQLVEPDSKNEMITRCQ